MKLKLLLLSFTLALVGCGGKNQSGRPQLEAPPEATPLVTPEESSSVRREFMEVGRRLLRNYDRELRHELDDQSFEFIKLNFRRENIELSEDVLTLGGSFERPVRSINHGYRLVLYTGTKYPHLSWEQTFNNQTPETDYLVMHEILELAGIDDHGMVRTKRILGRQQRPNRRR